MQPLHRIIDDAPAAVPIPAEFQHRRIELIIRALDERIPAAGATTESLTQFAGAITWPIDDALQWQRQLRDEWA